MKQRIHLAVNAGWQQTMAQIHFENIWNLTLKLFSFELSKKAKYFWVCSAMHQSPKMQSIGAQTTCTTDCHWQNWEMFFSTFLDQNKYSVMPFLHWHVKRERHDQIEDDLKTLSLFGNTFLCLEKYPQERVERAGEVWGCLKGCLRGH